MLVEPLVIDIIRETLSLNSDQLELDRDTALMGVLPEFDSMAVVSVITALEERLGLLIDDDELAADIFTNVGTLIDFVEAKLAA